MIVSNVKKMDPNIQFVYGDLTIINFGTVDDTSDYTTESHGLNK
jgi:hypothetical protein